MSTQNGELDPAPEPRRALKVGLLGCGTVGAPVASALLEEGGALEQAAGVPLELARVAVHHPGKQRPVVLPSDIVTIDPLAVAIDPSIDIVIEVMGGINPAFGCIIGALDDNKSVVTANKELLAGPGASLLDDDSSADLSFEAAACGAIPIVRTLKECRGADRIESFTGIFSGTCNFVLSRMTRSRCSFDDALAEAQRLGYAESDATADIEAFDAGAKVALLARVAFGAPVNIDSVDRKGIADIDKIRIGEAASEGYVYKLVGGARRIGSRVDAWVRPVLVPRADPMAQIEGAENAVSVQTTLGGRLRFQGQGAGGEPTAAAVLGDLVRAARRRVQRASTLPPCLASTKEALTSPHVATESGSPVVSSGTGG